MIDIVVGQRWVSHTEQSLGLGIIQDISGRLVTIDFPAAEAQRTYARDNAPLSRIIYSVGDTVTSHDEQKYLVLEVLEEKGLVGYACEGENGQEIIIPEMMLNSHVHFTTPRQRLLSGQFDGNSAFRLRMKTLQYLHDINHSEVTGLMAGRMDLLPHQIYIASEVSNRYQPRVLLADEVGLGKTIEAAMIIHHQLLTHQARRVLVLVPESLMHQWFVELLRRFNLHFSLLNKDRLNDSIVINDDGNSEISQSNPFEMEQLVITSLDIVQENPQFSDWLTEANWDMLVVDEAHHLEWTSRSVSDAYLLVEKLAENTPSTLLLTATPEQIGAAGHYARLRLLDPQRYDDLEAFMDEEQDYKSLNTALEFLEDQGNTNSVDMPAIYKSLKEVIAPQLFHKLETTAVETPEQLINQLLDLHGTGRVLFRNQRSHISGFPTRNNHYYPLEHSNASKATHLDVALYPEQLVDDESWLETDPRVKWLTDYLRENKRQKVLVICHHDNTALALDKYLNLKQGIRTTAFVPELSIVERDRAAAYFAETEAGAQALICSEIGSEGRNFQFSQNLVLFDLPLNPDLVEQRIGRLDRIGQQDEIHIHIPVIEKSAQDRLYQWYHYGLDLFSHTASAGYAIYRHFKPMLERQLLEPDDSFESLLHDTKTYRIKLNHELQEGKDRLLERNSCNQAKASILIEQVTELETSDNLKNYMQNLFDEYGVETETHSEGTWIIKPSEQMREQHFPGLKDDGQTVTFSRTKAIAREDYDFLTWEHPMVNESMEAIRDSELGNAAVATIKVKGLKPATLLMEACFTVTTSAPKNLQIERYLGLNPLRLLTDIRGKDLSQVVDHTVMNKLARRMPRELARKACQQLRPDVEIMITSAEKMAVPHLATSQQQALSRLEEIMGCEISRLQQLANLNPNIRLQEIEALVTQKEQAKAAIERAEIQLQAVRLLITQ